jgi:hypothetical protein
LPAAATLPPCISLQAFARLALRVLLHQLQESPTLLECSVAAGMLLPALGQMLTYSSAPLQVRQVASKHHYACVHVSVTQLGLEGWAVLSLVHMVEGCVAWLLPSSGK